MEVTEIINENGKATPETFTHSQQTLKDFGVITNEWEEMDSFIEEAVKDHENDPEFKKPEPEADLETPETPEPDAEPETASFRDHEEPPKEEEKKEVPKGINQQQANQMAEGLVHGYDALISRGLNFLAKNPPEAYKKEFHLSDEEKKQLKPAAAEALKFIFREQAMNPVVWLVFLMALMTLPMLGLAFAKRKENELKEKELKRKEEEDRKKVELETEIAKLQKENLQADKDLKTAQAQAYKTEIFVKPQTDIKTAQNSETKVETKEKYGTLVDGIDINDTEKLKETFQDNLRDAKDLDPVTIKKLKVTRQRIVRFMQKSGMSMRDIATKVGISLGQVSRIAGDNYIKKQSG